MQSQTQHVDTLKAYLTKDITYIKDGLEIFIAKDQAVVVDIVKGIGFFKGDHFDIDQDEYQLV